MNTFADLGIPSTITQTLSKLGYEQPTPIQQASIPVLLRGQDLLAQAQTGTGKTAAFALPILSQIDLDRAEPQALVLAPTRELAIQLAEAFQAYAKDLPGFHVLPVYGGQNYRHQLKALSRGTHVVVGTPGRIMDHIERGTLKLGTLKTLVLDEADEMLRMGFIEDVQWILKHIPKQHHTALFSATMPPAIKNVVKDYLHNPEKIHIQAKTRALDTIDQYYTIVAQKNKLEALTRFLDMEERNGMIIFARTKIATTELAEKLAARGYSTAAMNGDMKQAEREKVIDRIKSGKLNIVVATEVAARGLDVDRITHVVNYDIPHDPESYIHRIGRTGRAGRNGKALLLVTPREQRMLGEIERTLKMTITQVTTPTAQEITQKKREAFHEQILSAMDEHKMDRCREQVEALANHTESSMTDIAAALYSLLQPRNSGHDNKDINLDFEEPQRRKKGRSEGRRNAPFKDKGRGKPSKKSKENSKGYDKGKSKAKPKDRTNAKTKKRKSKKAKFAS